MKSYALRLSSRVSRSRFDYQLSTDSVGVDNREENLLRAPMESA